MRLPFPFDVFFDTRTDEEKKADKWNAVKLGAGIIAGIAILIIVIALMFRLFRYLAQVGRPYAETAVKLAPLAVI